MSKRSKYFWKSVEGLLKLPFETIGSLGALIFMLFCSLINPEYLEKLGKEK